MMKYRDVLQRMVALAVSVCLLLSLTGCGGQSEPEPSESQTQPAESQEPTSSSNSQDQNEVTANNPGTVVVETDYYTIDIPWEWEEYCSCEKMPGAGEDFLTFTVKDKYLEEYSDNVLFELAAIPGPEYFPDYYNSEQYSYICQIHKDGTFMLNLMHRLPDDIRVKEQYQDLLATLQEFIPYVIQSIDAKDGFTLSYEPLEVDDGIPYVPTAWIEILGQQFSPSGQYEVIDVTDIRTYNTFVPYYLNETGNTIYYKGMDYMGTGELKRNVYGVRDGVIVAYTCYDDSVYSYDNTTEVRTFLSADFDGIAPKTIITDQGSRFHVWRVSNGYVVLCVAHLAYMVGQDYSNDLVMHFGFFEDKEMCSLLTEY